MFRPRWLWGLLALFIMNFCAAAAMFFGQGGFGAGHGPLDLPIYLFGFPAVLFLESALSKVPGAHASDLVLIIVSPFVFNLFVCWLPLFLIHRLTAKWRRDRWSKG